MYQGKICENCKDNLINCFIEIEAVRQEAFIPQSNVNLQGDRWNNEW